MRLKNLNSYSMLLGLFFIQGCSTFKEEPPKPSTPHKQLMCLAEAIHGEARGEPEEGKIFVGRVIITRVEKGFGKNYCDVVYSKRQFAPKKRPRVASINAAKKSQQLGANGITHFHSYKRQRTPAAVFSTAPHCESKGRVGGHWGFTCYEHGLRKTASSDD
ncbi:cell wall hydrolase [bacterium]|nr:cell wall hydrolase [bacterium]